jgi:hypothetical protein
MLLRFSGTQCLPALASAAFLIVEPALADPTVLPVRVTADSTYQTYYPYKILDWEKEAADSRWVSAKVETPHWIRFQFDSPVSFDRVQIFGQDPPYAMIEAELQVASGGGWTTIWSVTANAQAVVDASFAEVTTSDIRLYVTKGSESVTPYGYAVRLYEVVFNSGETQLPAIAEELLDTGPPRPPPPEPPLEAGLLVESVRPVSASALVPPPAGGRVASLLQSCFDSVLAWDDILLQSFEPVPGHATWGYYGLGGYLEDQVRPITYAVLVNAFLAEAQAPVDELTEARRQRMRSDAVAALRYLTQAHVSGTGACLDGEYWGDQWQSAMWVRSAGLGGWILWPRLDPDMKLAVARMVEREADRFLHLSPKSSEFGDTGAEENAWNSQLLALACGMMPNHSRAGRWAECAKRYMYNTLSVAADEQDNTPGEDGLPIADWVSTVNVHPDFTLENHGIVHVGYLKTSMAQLLESSVHYLLGQQSVPTGAVLHHVPDCFRVLTRCMAWDASAVYFSGDDWKGLHTQCADLVIYTLLSTLAGDAHAASLEEVGVEYLRRIQQLEEGYYNDRRDLEYGGLCASRLIACYLAHAMLGEGASPAGAQAMQEYLSNVTYLQSGQAVLHRTPTKFASFSWGPKRMGLALPVNGTWAVWSHFAGYIGRINGTDASENQAILEALVPDIQPSSFSVAGRLKRFDGGLTQEFAFASLQRDIVVYVERLTAEAGFSMASRETGIVGHEYEIGENTRRFYHASGSTTVTGEGNPAQVLEWPTDWLNMDGRVGYVIRRAPPTTNLVTYHDMTSGSGTVPKLQEWFSLIGDEHPPDLAQPQWACVVSFLNQSPGGTQECSGRVQFAVDGSQAVCHIGPHSVAVDFGAMTASIHEEVPAYAPGDLDTDDDVDQEDFGLLQVCLTGSFAGPPAPGCQAADLDADGDVDQGDVKLFIRCFSGPGNPADRFCDGQL